MTSINISEDKVITYKIKEQKSYVIYFKKEKRKIKLYKIIQSFKICVYICTKIVSI